MTTPHKPTATADQLAAASGLFNQSKKQPSGIPDGPLGPPSRRSQPTNDSQRKPSDNPTAPKHPRNSQDVDQVEQVPNQGQTDANPADTLLNPVTVRHTLQELYDGLVVVWADKSRRWATLRSIHNALNKYHDLKDRFEQSLPSGNKLVAREDQPITREELLGIITTEIRRTGRTGSDVKGLSTTLKDLLPDLFRDERLDRKPDPCAVLSYVVSFAGMTGPEIIQSLGGRDFVRNSLADILKTAVVLPDPVQ